MVGQRLKELRRKRGIRQEDLAIILGIQKATVSNYETGRIAPSNEITIKIGKLFDISLDYLLGIIDDDVSCYRPEIFLKIPSCITPNERALLEEMITSLEFKRKHLLSPDH